MHTVYRYEKGKLTVGEREVVAEHPVLLEVNGREIATLIASPHELNFLVVGFLRLQGMVHELDDLLDLEICHDYGIARIKIKGELPEKLKPVLTSGCGTGISFTIPEAKRRLSTGGAGPLRRFTPSQVFRMMDELSHKAQMYRSHGGMHSAGIGRGTVELFAEDLGRHNTMDRIAGEALLTEVDLAGTMFVTSGRISTELVAKAALLGVEVIASRTSPTETAVRMANEAGITIIGYVRAERFDIFCHPDRIETDPTDETIPGMTGVILAGGASSRMGSNKALLLHKGGRIIEGIYRTMSALFSEVILVTNDPQLYDFIPCQKVADLYPGMAVLGGIHAGLKASRNQAIFAVACDMPQLNPELIRHLAELRQGVDLVIPKTPGGYEPLHAIYGKGCLPEMEALLERGERRVLSLVPRLRSREVSCQEVEEYDRGFDSFVNINTPDDYYKLRTGGKNDPEPGRLMRSC